MVRYIIIEIKRLHLQNIQKLDFIIYTYSSYFRFTNINDGTMLLTVICITILSLVINEANANVAIHDGIEDLTVNGDSVNLVFNIGIDEPFDHGKDTDDNTGWEPVVIDEEVQENEEPLGNCSGRKFF